MNWTLVSLAAVPPQAWRNGGGTTRELLAWPSAGDWRVRLSVADVERAGPFSAYPGVERWFAVLEGEGVLLRVGDGDGEHRLTRDSAPFRFDGAAAVDCALLAGSTRDFNLMAVAGGAGLQRVHGELAISTRVPSLVALYAHGQPARVTLAGGNLELPPFHLAWTRTDATVSGTAGGADALWMEVAA